MAAATGLSIADFERLTDEEAHNHELINGELVEVSGNVSEHLVLQGELFAILRAFVKEHKLGLILMEQEFAFGDNAHGPDLAFIGSEKRAMLNLKKRVQLFVPDLAIEIVSETDKFGALLKKCNRYRQCGTPEVWIFYIELRQAFRLSEAGDVILGENDLFAPLCIPGLSIQIGKLFDSILN